MARDLYSQMAQAVIDGEADEAAELARQGLAEGLPAADIIDKGFVKGIEEVGDLFGKGEFFLPELVQGAEAMKSAVAVLQPELDKTKGGRKPLGVVAPKDGAAVPVISEMAAACGEQRSIAICAMPSPPLMHDADALSKLIACAELEVPVIYAPAPAAGASTQRVDKPVRQLGIDGISKSQASRLAVTHDETVEAIRGRPLETAHPHLALDALQVKVREAGCTVSVGCGTDADRRYVSLEAHPTRSRSATRRPPRRCG